MTTDATLYK